MKHHLWQILALTGAITAAATAAASQYRPYEPPFAAGEQRFIHPAKAVNGKELLTFHGSAMSLRCFTRAVPTLFDAQLKVRWGGLVLEHAGKALNGQCNYAPGKATFTYPELPGLTQELFLDEQGLLQCVITPPPGKGNLTLNLSLITEFFGGSSLQLDEKKYSIAPYQEGQEFYRIIHNDTIKNVRFFVGDTSRELGLILPADTTLKAAHSGAKYGLNLRFTLKDGAPFRYAIDLGRAPAPGNDAHPAGYTVKRGNYDFWREDRLRLADNFQGRNLLTNSSFEGGFYGLWFQHGGSDYSPQMWREKPIAIEEEAQAISGTKVLRIRSDKRVAGLSTNISVHPVILEPGVYTLSLYARTNSPGKQRLKVDNRMLPPGGNIWSGQSHNTVEFHLTDQWQRFSRTFHIQVTQPHYFTLSALSDLPATCQVDGLQLEKGDAMTQYEPALVEGYLVTSAADNFLAHGAVANGKVQIFSAQPYHHGTLTFTLKDFFNQELRREVIPYATAADGRSEVAVNLEQLPPGIFVVELNFDGGKAGRRYQFSRLAVMDFLNNTHRHKNLFSNAYIDAYSDKQIFPEVLERYRRIGIGSRSALANTRKAVADEAAKYGVDSLSALVLRTHRNHPLIQGLPRPAYAFTVNENVVWFQDAEAKFKDNVYSAVTFPFTDKTDLKALEDASARRVAENPWIQVWGAINEAAGSCPEFAHSRYATPENYRYFVETELAVARGIRKGNPKALVANSSTANINQDRVETMDRLLTEIGNRFRYDAFLFHIYRKAPEYPDLDQDLQRMMALLTKHGYHDQPIYCPEGMHWKPYKMPGLLTVSWIDCPWGPFSYDMGHQERLVSAWRARTWLVGLKHAQRIKVMNSSTNFWGFEMDAALTPFATQKISNTLGRILGNANYLSDYKFSSQSRCYLFQDEHRRPIAVLWSCDPKVDEGLMLGQELLFKNLPKDLEFLDLMEAPHPMPKRLRLTSFPVFIRGKADTLPQMRQMLEEAALIDETRPAIDWDFYFQPPQQCQLQLSNPGRREFQGVIRMAGEETQVHLRPGEKRALPVALPSVPSLNRLVYGKFDATMEQQLPTPGTYRHSMEFQTLRIKKRPITVDGKLDDWQGIPAIPINQLRLESRPDVLASRANEFTAQVKLAWDERGFYMLVEVNDHKFTLNPQTLPSNGWRNDSVQLFFDGFADARHKERDGLDVDDWSYGIYVDPATRQPYAYIHHAPDVQLTHGFNGAKAATIAKDVQIKVVEESGRRFYEIAFPNGTLLPFTAASNKTVGLGILVNNQNTTATTPQARRHWGFSNQPLNNYPRLWPLMVLDAE